ncbi:MAG: hypothetical protein AAGM67_15295, partial [Bacteroidota bacterium]
EILADNHSAKAITESTYKIIDQQIHDHLKACKDEFKADKVTLLGGIIINTDYGLDDYFDVRNFEVVDMKNI